MAQKLIDMTGKRIGRLTVLSYAGLKDHTSQWRCKCDCGKETFVSGSSLRRGNVVSCGCYRNEIRPIVNHERRTHGESTTRLYRVWASIRTRCNENNAGKNRYKYYAGRGIKVCDEWASYERFKEWALSNGYEPGLTIDRIDTNGPYSPDNCRWTTYKVQNNNRRSTLFITINGETHSTSEWADIADLRRSTVYQRYVKGERGERLLRKSRSIKRLPPSIEGGIP